MYFPMVWFMIVQIVFAIQDTRVNFSSNFEELRIYGWGFVKDNF